MLGNGKLSLNERLKSLRYFAASAVALLCCLDSNVIVGIHYERSVHSLKEKVSNHVKQKRMMSTSVLVKASILAAISVVLTRALSIMVPLGGLPALRVGFGSIPLIMAGMMFGPVVGGVVGVVADLVGVMMNPMGGSFFPGFTLSSALYGVISGLMFQTFKIQNSKKNFNWINTLVMVGFGFGMIGLLFYQKFITFSSGKLSFNDPNALLVAVLVIVVMVIFIVLPYVLSAVFKNHTKGTGFDKIAFNVNVTYIINSLILNTIWLVMMFDKGFMVFLPGRVIAAMAIIPIYTLIIYTIGRYIHLTEQ